MKVAIIGAGPSGLCAAKEIAEANPTAQICIYERAQQLGGGFATSYNGLTLVNNPMLINFSDFLADETLPDLRMWTAEEYVRYLQRYASHFNLHSRVHYNSELRAAVWQDGAWRLSIACDNEVRTQAFDYLVISAGSNHHSYIPQLPAEHFTGSVLHASQVKNAADFAGKHVLLIGLGETGSDLANMLAEHAASVTVSIRRWPGYFIPRYHDGRPTDLDTCVLYHRLPSAIDSSAFGWLLKLKRKAELLRIKSTKDRAIQEKANELNNGYAETRHLGPFRRTSTKSCGVIEALLEKRLTLQGELLQAEGNTAHFAHSCVYVDTIICCTGYRLSFPFLPASLREHIHTSNSLYNYIFPPEAHKNLAFIGYVRPAVGSVPPLAELQSRILARYLAGKLELPDTAAMQQAICRQQELVKAQFPLDYARVTHLVDYFSYMKTLATQLGVMPNQWALLRQSPLLWLKVNCAFICPAMFRLHGPGNRYFSASAVIKRLPPMPLFSIAVEVSLNGMCWLLSALGLKAYRTK